MKPIIDVLGAQPEHDRLTLFLSQIIHQTVTKRRGIMSLPNVPACIDSVTLPIEEDQNSSGQLL